MFQRDYLQRLIEEAGQVIARLAGLRERRAYEAALKLLDEVYDAYFPFSRHQIAHTEPEDLPGTEDLSDDQVTILADLMREEAEIWFDQGQWERGQARLRGALHLLRELDAQQPDLYSFDRAATIAGLRKRIDEQGDHPPE
jgi:hypothetical protein